MAAMTPEERAAFVAKAAEFAEKANAKSASEAEVGDASAVSVDNEAASAAAPQTPGVVYLYEAALADTVIPISTALPAVYHWLIRKALAKDPADRPDDAMLERLLATPKDAQHAPTAVETPMKSFFKVDGWRL